MTSRRDLSVVVLVVCESGGFHDAPPSIRPACQISSPIGIEKGDAPTFGE